MDYAKPSLADALAAQYVAGTLRGAARRRFEALLPGHPGLQTAVLGWRARLMPLTAVVASEAPPAHIWAQIEQRLWPEATVAAQPSLLADGAALWRGLAFWRAAAGVTTTAALALGVLLTNPPPQDAPMVVVLQGTEAGGPAMATIVASVSSDGRALVAQPLQPVALAAGRVLELWAVPPDGAPRSLGLISAAGATVIRREKLPQAWLDKRHTAALAVSIEPPGGSPTGTPTGPVVFAGKLQL